MKHFGLEIKENKNLRMNKDDYAIINKKSSLPMFPIDIYEDESGKTYKDEWSIKHREQSLINYDLNIKYFKSLNKDEFNSCIDKFLTDNPQFVSTNNLSKYKGVAGYYLIVLGDYNQIYIGNTEDIAKRIRQHWSKTKSFDRLLCPMNAVNTSLLSIDAFRALDTTSIYVYETTKIYQYEDKYINLFPSKFICNRVGGGEIDLLQAYATRRNRNL